MTFPGGTFTPVNSCCLPLLITGSWTSIRPLMNKIASYHPPPSNDAPCFLHTLAVALFHWAHPLFLQAFTRIGDWILGKCLEDLSVMGGPSCKTTAASCQMNRFTHCFPLACLQDLQTGSFCCWIICCCKFKHCYGVCCFFRSQMFSEERKRGEREKMVWWVRVIVIPPCEDKCEAELITAEPISDREKRPLSFMVL